MVTKTSYRFKNVEKCKTITYNVIKSILMECKVREMASQGMGSQMMTINRRKFLRRSEAELQRLAKSYDFKKTNRFPKESITILENIYSTYVRTLTNTLSARLGAPVKMHIESISQMKYLDYMMQNEEGMVTSIFTMEPIQGSFFLNVSSPLAFMCIDSICGGSLGTHSFQRDFTEIEKKLLTILVGYLLEPLTKSWSDYASITPMLKSLEFNLFNMQYVTDDESVVVVDIMVEVIDGHYYPLNFILPYRSMEGLLEKFVKLVTPDQHMVEPNQESMTLLETQLKNSQIEMEVLLGKTALPVSKINQLKVGEVIKLNSKVSDLLPIMTEEQIHFYVQPGMHSNKLAVQVVEIADELTKGV